MSARKARALTLPVLLATLAACAATPAGQPITSTTANIAVRPTLADTAAAQTVRPSPAPLVRKAPKKSATTAPTRRQTTPTSTPTVQTRQAAATVAGSTKPNIIMVMADDMRADDLDFAPNLRNLVAANGITMSNSFSPFPLCCPARASFISGQYAHNHGVYWHAAPYGYRAFNDSKSIATSLRAAGYNTAFIGKYLNGYGPDRSLVSGGPSYKFVPPGWTDWYASFEPFAGSPYKGGTYNYWNSPYNINGRTVNTFGGRYQTNVLGEFSRTVTRKYHKSSKPFFMYLSFVAPHHTGPEKDDPKDVLNSAGENRDGSFLTPARPNWVKGRFNNLVKHGAGIPANGGPSEADMSDKPSQFRNRSEVGPAERAALTEVTRQRGEAIYVMDQEIGRLIADLKKTGEWKNTVFMFTSDNGYFLGEHRQRSGKVRAHEPSLRVPFLVTGPGMRTKATRNDPISTVDGTASILALAGAKAPRPADGTSKVRTWRSGDQGWKVPVVTEAVHTTSAPWKAESGFARTDPRTSIGIRVARYSMTIYRNGEGELYDLKTDPFEDQNKFGNPAYAKVQDELMQVWANRKDCAAATCRAAATPAAATATAAQGKTLTQGYWQAIKAKYHR